MVTESWKSLMLAGWNQRKAVELAIAIEDRGAEAYRALAGKWESSDSLRTLFARLEGEEVAHREGLQHLLSGHAGAPDASKDLDAECLQAVAHGFFVSDEGFALSGIEKLTDRGQVLEKILKFENATLHFYRGLRDLLGPSPALDQMIAEEKQHGIAVMRAMATA
jgi:rubrerythrin